MEVILSWRKWRKAQTGGTTSGTIWNHLEPSQFSHLKNGDCCQTLAGASLAVSFGKSHGKNTTKIRGTWGTFTNAQLCKGTTMQKYPQPAPNSHHVSSGKNTPIFQALATSAEALNFANGEICPEIGHVNFNGYTGIPVYC